MPIREHDGLISAAVAGSGELIAQQITADRDQTGGTKQHCSKPPVATAEVQHGFIELLLGHRSRFYRAPQGDRWCKPVKLQKGLKQVDGLSRNPV